VLQYLCFQNCSTGADHVCGYPHNGYSYNGYSYNGYPHNGPTDCSGRLFSGGSLE
jgi:hypothetical protein